MPEFRSGTSLNNCSKSRLNKRRHDGKYIRIRAGKQRGMYVHQLVALAKYGRLPEDWEEIDHGDNDTLNNHPDNIFIVPKSVNAAKTRRNIAAKAKRGEEYGNDGSGDPGL